MNHQSIELLLVEDNDDDIILIQEAFAEARLLNVMHVVRDGEEALAYLRRQGPYTDAPRPGLILLDISMPKKNGFEVLAELKAEPTLRQIPVVMLTVSQQEADIVQSYATGACSYISKPVEFAQLQEVVKQFELYWTMVSRLPSQPR